MTLPDTQTSTTNFSGSVYGSGGYGSYSGTGTTTTYGSRTTYIPYNVRRYDQAATYWIKSKDSFIKLGIRVIDLTPEARQALGSNKGMLILAVIKNSPAFHADIINGDILRRVGEIEIYNGDSYQEALVKYAGAETQVIVWRKGNEIGQLAQTYFKGGIEVKNEYWDIEGAIKKTEELIKDGKSVVYEATAKSPEGIYSKIDILKKVKGKDEWDLIEVKGSTSLKDYHIWDMASQRLAFVGAGYKIRNSILMHVNNGYVRKGDLDVKQLFALQDCTNEVIERQKKVKDILPELISVLKKRKEPSVDIGSHCDKPFSCDYKEHCWSHVPEYSVYDVVSGKKLDELVSMGILNAKDIPKNFSLGAKVSLAVKSYRDNREIVDVPALKKWLQNLEYSLYYLDYETAGPAVPKFHGTSPYQQCPFQYSLHIQKTKGGKLQHLEFLHTEPTDPRESFVKSLIENCGKEGSVVAYNASFEVGVNNNLAEQFPKYRNKLKAINNRVVDLLKPFMSRALYHPKQMGSASIKAVLPSFVPDMSYDNLNVTDGQEASRLGSLILEGDLEEDALNETIIKLKEYCGQDTLAMVKLIEVIYSYISK